MNLLHWCKLGLFYQNNTSQVKIFFFLIKMIKPNLDIIPSGVVLCGLTEQLHLGLCIWAYIMMKFFGLGNVCGIATEKLMQEREKSSDFMRKVGMKVMFSAEKGAKTNLLWERCPGGGGVGSGAADRGRMFCSQCQIPHGPHGDARGFHSSLSNFCNLFCQPSV